jgi:hypothetical protein
MDAGGRPPLSGRISRSAASVFPAATDADAMSRGVDFGSKMTSPSRFCASACAFLARIVDAAAMSDSSIRGALTGFPTTVDRIDPTSPTPPRTAPPNPGWPADNQRIRGWGAIFAIVGSSYPASLSSAFCCSFSICCPST